MAAAASSKQPLYQQQRFSLITSHNDIIPVSSHLHGNGVPAVSGIAQYTQIDL
jgi:hypothetical protein